MFVYLLRKMIRPCFYVVKSYNESPQPKSRLHHLTHKITMFALKTLSLFSHKHSNLILLSNNSKLCLHNLSYPLYLRSFPCYQYIFIYLSSKWTEILHYYYLRNPKSSIISFHFTHFTPACLSTSLSSINVVF